MKQDKGRGVVTMDKTKYQEKCLTLLNKSVCKTKQRSCKTNQNKNSEIIEKN